MAFKEHFILMADYNHRMNNQVIETSMHLSEEALTKDRGTYFRSIIGTLNHILVGDIIWLSRFSTHSDHYESLKALTKLPKPQALDDVIFSNLSSFSKARNEIDSSLSLWLKYEVVENDFSQSLSYSNTKGIVSERNFGELVCHLFNHQTHHRGQLTTLLNQLGLDVGVTDFLIDIPEI